MNDHRIEPQVLVQSVTLTLPIWQFDLSQELDLDLTKAKIKQIQGHHPRSTQTNVKTSQGWRSPYLTARDTLIQEFTPEVSCIQSKLKYINSFATTLVNLWAVIYAVNDTAKEHNHYSLWDFTAYNTVLYLTDTLTPIVFGQTEIYPTKGQLVVMHPLTLHHVPPVKDQERIVLCCNFQA